MTRSGGVPAGGLGHMVVAGLRYEVTGVGLRGGKIVITARREGPVPPLEREPAAIFGADGQGVGQGGEFSAPATEPGGCCELTAGLRIESLRSEDQ